MATVISTLPQWAAAYRRNQPIGMDQAADVLRISRRLLTTIIAKHPHYEMRLNKKVFRPDHIKSLDEVLKTWTEENSSKSNSSNGPAAQTGTPKSNSLAGTESEKALEHLAKKRRSRSPRPTPTRNGNVTAMVRQQ